MDPRSELLPQLVSLYASLPEPKIALGTPPRLVGLTKGQASAEAARALIERWAKSSRIQLKNAALAALKRF
jgi:hypothetical protein